MSTTMEDILAGAAVGTSVAGAAGAAVGSTALAGAAATVAAALSSTGVGAAVVAVGAAVAGLVALIDSDGDDSGSVLEPRKAQVPMVTVQDACGPRRLSLWRAVGSHRARLGWEKHPHPIPNAAARDLVYAIRRMREDGLAYSEIHRWVAEWCRRQGFRLGEQNARMQAAIAERTETQMLARAGRGPFALTYVSLRNAGCQRSTAIRRAMARDSSDALSPMGAARLASRGAFLDPEAWACRERAVRAEFPVPQPRRTASGGTTIATTTKGSPMELYVNHQLSPSRPTHIGGQYLFTGAGQQRAIDPREATGTQLAIGAGGGAVGALVGYKIGKKKGGGAAKKYAILGGVAVALAAYFGAHAAGV